MSSIGNPLWYIPRARIGGLRRVVLTKPLTTQTATTRDRASSNKLQICKINKTTGMTYDDVIGGAGKLTFSKKL